MTRATSGAISLTVTGLPTWRQGLAQWEWVEIPNTLISAANPTANPGGSPAARIDAWGSMASDRGTGKLYISGSGGHADYAGNETIMINLSQNTPGWTKLREPTPAAQVTNNTPYYADGRPTSCHLYYSSHFVPTLNRVFRFGDGAGWPGAVINYNVNAFNLATNDWDAEDTWTDVTTGTVYEALSMCQDHSTGDVYVSAATVLRKFTASTQTWSNAGTWVQNGSAVTKCASAYDHTRSKAVFFGDAYRTSSGGLVLSGGTISNIDFTGAAYTTFLGTQSSADPCYQAGAQYDPVEDVFLVKSKNAGQLFRIHPTTYAVTLQSTTGVTPADATNGVFNRFQYLPTLKGYAYAPSSGQNMFFLASEV